MKYFWEEEDKCLVLFMRFIGKKKNVYLVRNPRFNSLYEMGVSVILHVVSHVILHLT